MSKINQIEQEIEELRQELIHLANIRGITDLEVLLVSQKLNVKLNEYNQLLGYHLRNVGSARD